MFKLLLLLQLCKSQLQLSIVAVKNDVEHTSNGTKSPVFTGKLLPKMEDIVPLPRILLNHSKQQVCH